MKSGIVCYSVSLRLMMLVNGSDVQVFATIPQKQNVS